MNPTPVRASGMLLLGSSGRNSGKTLFASRLIEHLRASHQDALSIVCLKVSTIRGTGKSCVRGRTDCGVCGSLCGEFDLTEETDAAGEKDTCRMLKAGADRVYWLKARPETLGAGFVAFADRLGPDDIVICESNSLRSVAIPDLFLMFTPSGATSGAIPMKRSARKMSALVDRTVTFDGDGFDVDLDDISVIDGQFAILRRGSAVLLAGGRSARMGVDKRFLELDGESLIERSYNRLLRMFDHVLVSSNDTPEGIPIDSVVADEHPGTGPIGGIVGCLDAAASDPAFVVACDIPYFDQGLVSSLYRAVQNSEIAVSIDEEGRYETLFAMYRKSVCPTIRELIADGEYRIRRSYSLVSTIEVPVPPGTNLRNINTRQEYDALLGSRRWDLR